MKYFLALLTFTSPDDQPLDFGDYCAGAGMWMCITVGGTCFVLAINLWLQL